MFVMAYCTMYVRLTLLHMKLDESTTSHKRQCVTSCWYMYPLSLHRNIKSLFCEAIDITSVHKMSIFFSSDIGNEAHSYRNGGRSAIGTVPLVVFTALSVSMLLLGIMTLFLCKKHSVYRRRFLRHASPVSGAHAPPPYSEMEPEPRGVETAVVTEHDRTALISFADGTQATLPTYDEVVHSRYPTSLRRENFVAASRSTSRVGGQAAQIASLVHSGSQQHPTAMRELTTPERSRDQHAMHSQPRGDSHSVTFGSMDTINVSDNTSTTVTIGTYESGTSNPSLATSRGLIGSMGSHPSLDAEGS